MKFSKIFFAGVLFYLFYISLVLTNGYLPDFFEHINRGSTLYANVWHHFKQGNFLINPKHTGMEYFILNNGGFTVYFGFFPAFIRGFFDIFIENIYKINFNNLSILLALGTAISFLYRTFLKLGLFSEKTRLFSVMIFIALFLASPVCYITAWGWMYNEPIIWGFAWTIGYISLFFLWVFGSEEDKNKKNAVLMGFCVSMAVLSRAIDAIIPVMSFIFLILKTIFDKDKSKLRMLSAGILICLVFSGFAMKINMDRWGNPLVFQRFDRHVQVINNPDRLQGVQKYGMWNLSRLYKSFLYYYLPSQENFKEKFPFVDVDRELTIMQGRPYYDLIMTSRVPLSLSALFLLVFGLIGVYKYRSLDKKEKAYLYPIILGGLLQYFALLIYGGLALRYSMGFVFLIVVFNMVLLIVESRESLLFRNKKFLYSSIIVLFISLYINFFTMLAYKHYIWDISHNTRHFLGKFINYTPDEKHLYFIKNNTKSFYFSPGRDIRN